MLSISSNLSLNLFIAPSDSFFPRESKFEKKMPYDLTFFKQTAD